MGRLVGLLFDEYFSYADLRHRKYKAFLEMIERTAFSCPTMPFRCQLSSRAEDNRAPWQEPRE